MGVYIVTGERFYGSYTSVCSAFIALSGHTLSFAQVHSSVRVKCVCAERKLT